jgi:hypothetical protein
MKLHKLTEQVELLLIQAVNDPELNLTARSLGMDAQTLLRTALVSSVDYVTENPDLTEDEIKNPPDPDGIYSIAAKEQREKTA